MVSELRTQRRANLPGINSLPVRRSSARRISRAVRSVVPGFVYGIAQHKVAHALRADDRNKSDPVDTAPDVAGEDNAPE